MSVSEVGACPQALSERVAEAVVEVRRLADPVYALAAPPERLVRRTLIEDSIPAPD
jgi:hypothetical protein